MYFISYRWYRGNCHGAGCCDCDIKKICSMDDIGLVRDAIKEKHHPDADAVVVVNWKRFEEQEAQQDDK